MEELDARSEEQLKLVKTPTAARVQRRDPSVKMLTLLSVGADGNSGSLDPVAALTAAPRIAPRTLVPTTVELTDPSLSFDLSSIETTLEQHSLDLDSCGPDASRLGKTQPVELLLTLEADGKVARLDWQAAPPAVVRQCIQRQLYGIRFPRMGRPLELRVTWVQR